MIDVIAASDPNYVQPVPDTFSAGEVWSGVPWAFTILSFVLFGLCIFWGVRNIVRKRDYTLLILAVGGFIAGPIGEPWADLLCHGWWPHDHLGPILIAWGIRAPLLIAPIYGFYLGAGGYVIYKLMQSGTTVKKIFQVWAVMVVVDFAFQVAGINLSLYRFYGDQPFMFFNVPIIMPIMDSTAYVLIGLIAWWLFYNLHGARRAIVVLAPLIGWFGGCAMTAWPHFMAISMDLPVPAAWALASGAFVLNVLAVWAMALIAATDSTWKRPMPTGSLDRAVEESPFEADSTQVR